jgi:hypothetical protein
MLSVKEHSVWICKTGHHHRSHYSTAPEYRAHKQHGGLLRPACSSTTPVQSVPPCLHASREPCPHDADRLAHIQLGVSCMQVATSGQDPPLQATSRPTNAEVCVSVPRISTTSCTLTCSRHMTCMCAGLA